MATSILKKYGLSIHFNDPSGHHSQIIKDLEDDFRFLPEEGLKSSLSVFICFSEVPNHKYSFVGHKDEISIYGWGNKRIFHKHGCRYFIDFCENRRMDIQGENTQEIYMTIYLFLLSTFIEFFQNEGWSSFHGLSFRHKNCTYGLVAPSGYGKSHLFFQLTKKNYVSLLGDEIFFLKENELFAIPLRIALAKATSSSRTLVNQKSVIDYFFKEPSALQSTKEFKLLVATKKSAEWISVADEASYLKAFWLLGSGQGLPQMLEYALRPAYLIMLFFHLTKRLGLVARLWSQQKIILCGFAQKSENDFIEFIEKL